MRFFRRESTDEKFDRAVKAAQAAKASSDELKEAIAKRDRDLDRLFAELLPKHRDD
ncbi:hypothetical protein ACRARG_04480 [Pseudooceanicola sp. C21-150M6]|uniref:hypothetical protein n=1 Tax=Pseudooceanicola sp. C21-150M6 TaxID=3434355 RepID=UPI003D7F9EC9